MEYPLRIAQAIAVVSRNYAEVVTQVLSTLDHGEPLRGTPQNAQAATYRVWLDDLDYRIDWTLPAERILHLIHCVGFPYKGAATRMGADTVRIHDAAVTDDVRIENRHPGKVLFVDAGRPVVICGQGLPKILAATVEGAAGARSLVPVDRIRIRFGA